MTDGFKDIHKNDPKGSGFTKPIPRPTRLPVLFPLPTLQTLRHRGAHRAQLEALLRT